MINRLIEIILEYEDEYSQGEVMENMGIKNKELAYDNYRRAIDATGATKEQIAEAQARHSPGRMQ